MTRIYGILWDWDLGFGILKGVLWISILIDFAKVVCCGKSTITTRAGEHGFRLPKRATRSNYF